MVEYRGVSQSIKVVPWQTNSIFIICYNLFIAL